MPRPKIRYRYPPLKPRTGPPPTRAELLEGICDHQLTAVLPKPLLLEAQRQAAHELKSVASYVKQALLEKVLRDIDDRKDKDGTQDRG
jgi:hypothetical protein